MNTARRVLQVAAIACGMSVTLQAGVAQPAFSTRDNVKVPMSDGVSLAADVYLPNTGKKFPAVLIRTPYSRKQLAPYVARPLAESGYAVVMQDVRGMGGSEGRFIPFIFDRKDGLDTLDWITKQDWCNGDIGMWGSSYPGYCALVLAPEDHPSLKAIVNLSGWGDTQAMTMPGGAMHLMVAVPWTLSRQIRGAGSFSDHDWPKVFRHIPVVEIPKALGIESPQWEGMVRLTTGGDLVKQAGIAGRYGAIKTPILHITGWHDFIARHTLDVYEGIDQADRRGAEPVAQKLIVGPWRHDQIWGNQTTVGDEDFGPQSVMGMSKVVRLSTRWFDRWLKDEKNGVMKEESVRLFVMGPNEWRTYDRWPPRGVRIEKWYLDSKGSANGLEGDGRLSRSKPAGATSDSFVFDPMDPAPTVGGANFHFFLDNLGVLDQRPVQARDDVLVYTSDPMKKDLTIIGPLAAVIYAMSEGKHTDFTAKLSEVRADGYARIIEDGIRRGPDAIDGSPVKTMETGKVYRFTIDLGATGIVIKKGNRLRVEVSSSNFPKYDRNPNTGEPPATATKFIKVRQTILHTAEHPSHIVLPLMRAE